MTASPPVGRVFRSRRVLLLALLGFSSGLPLLLTGQTLTAWMATRDVHLETIGIFSLVGLPYAFKWAWAPLLDRYELPFLGRRRGWMLTLQLALIGAIVAMGTMDPVGAPGALALAAVVVAFLSASQDVVLDAFAADSLEPDERAAGTAMYVTGYRVGMLVTGTLALIVADYLPWRTVYWALAACMGVGVAATFLVSEPVRPVGTDGQAARPSSLLAAVWRPFVLLLSRRRIAVILGFIALYRLGDAFALHMIIPFLKTGVGFSLTEIATMKKLLGFAGTVLGGIACAALVARYGLRRALISFGALQACTNLMYIWLAVGGKSLLVLGVAVFIDDLANAMGTGAFVAYLMSLCDRSVSATQYALMTSLSTLGARLFGYAAADLVGATGWTGFWIGTAVLFIPAAALALLLPAAAAPGDAPYSSRS